MQKLVRVKLNNNVKQNGTEKEKEILEANLKSYEPLPYFDQTLFEEKFDADKMKIHINPYAQNKMFFVPKKPIKIEISAEKKFNMIHPYIYTITITHHKYKWQVVRYLKEIRDMHKKLCKLVKANLGIACQNIPKNEIKLDWPLFPTKHDSLIPENKINAHCESLKNYLERLLIYPPYRNHFAVCSLLGVSPISFINGVSQSVIEGMIYKKSGDILLYGGCIKSRICCQKLKMWHEKRWFCLKDTYLVFLDSRQNHTISFVMLVDCEFQCKMQIKAGAYHAIEIKNLERRLELKFGHSHTQREWYEKIVGMLNTSARCFNDKSLLIYDSFAPVRKGQMVKWFLNAASYMENVMNALNNAKEEIYIGGWWLCPELYLKRPTDHLEYRLDKILVKKAQEGVKVYVLLYKEISFFLSLMTQRTRQVLTDNGNNPNIKVLRHPDHFSDGVFLWSHHEKIVIVDQIIAFLGGIDLCYGRWDDESHKLIDLGRKQNITDIKHANQTQSISNLVASHSEVNLSHDYVSILYKNKNLYSQQQLSSIVNLKNKKNSFENENELKLVRAFTSHQFTPNTLKKSTSSQKLPSPKESLKPVLKSFKNSSKINTSSQSSLNKFSISFLKTRDNSRELKKLSPTFDSTSSIREDAASPRTNDYQKPVKWVSTKNELMKRNSVVSFNKIFLPKSFKTKSSLKTDIYDRWHLNRVNESFIDLEESLPKNTDSGYYYWIGKDYANSYVEDFKDVHEFEKDQFNRDEVPRMPWRDQGCVLIGHAARDLARHFIQRWNQCKNEQVPYVDAYPYLIPKSYAENDLFNTLNLDGLKDDMFKCSVQILRSVDDWSAGICKTECSIQNAYCDLIKKAQHYIYIENQFFISSANPKDDNIIKNGIAKALVERIAIAHELKQNFRVFIFLPLLPGFNRMNTIKAVQYYNLRTIKFGEFSIYNQLKKAGVDNPAEYITFHGMRNWSVLMGKLVQEIIYVHSKLMIVDDKYVICGSANINDRSMLGKRDSEVAALIQDEEFFDSILNNQKYKAGRYAFSLRQKIFKVNLGINLNNQNQINVNDCVSKEFYELFKSISHQNTLVYDEVFKCIPSDNILTFKDLKNYPKLKNLNNLNPQEAKIKLEKFVMGLVVDFPLFFRSHEKNFFPDIVTAEGMVPEIIWT